VQPCILLCPSAAHPLPHRPQQQRRYGGVPAHARQGDAQILLGQEAAGDCQRRQVRAGGGVAEQRGRGCRGGRGCRWQLTLVPVKGAGQEVWLFLLQAYCLQGSGRAPWSACIPVSPIPAYMAGDWWVCRCGPAAALAPGHTIWVACCCQTLHSCLTGTWDLAGRGPPVLL
jgi:hypothetical protein